MNIIPPLLAVQDGVIPSPDMPVLEAYNMARDAGMHLITDGVRTVICRSIPPGWRKVPILVKRPSIKRSIEPCPA